MKWTCVLVGIVLMMAPPSVLAQADVLQVIPEDVIGFAVVNRLGQANEKLAALAKRLNMELPANPLELAKGALGVSKGLAENGSFAIAAFMGQEENAEPKKIVYVPVTNYKEFIAQFQPQEPKEGIAAITLKDGKAMLAANKGTFALLADAEDRELLTRALRADKVVATQAAPLTSWLAENDAAGVWTQRGIKLLGSKARKGIDEAKQNLGALPPEAQFVGKIFDGADDFVKAVQSDVSLASVAVRIDQAGLHIRARAQYVKESGFAKSGAALETPSGGPLAALPAGPFVMALGGAFPEKAMQSLMGMNMEMIKAGGQNISVESLKKLETAYASMMKGTRGMGFVWQAAKENQSLFGSICMVLHTDNAAAYLTRYEKGMKATNDVLKELKLPLMPAYDIKKVQVNGKPGLEVSADFGGDQGLPEELQKVFKTMFGAEGKMVVALAPRDDKTVVMRYTGADGLKELLDTMAKGLAGDTGVAQVSKALPAGAQWVMYFSPNGTTEFASYLVKTVVPLPLKIPQFPATPPVAVGARVSAQGFEMNAVIPSEVLDNVSAFVERVKRLIQGEI